jgi:hypothetical protein
MMSLFTLVVVGPCGESGREPMHTESHDDLAVAIRRYLFEADRLAALPDYGTVAELSVTLFSPAWTRMIGWEWTRGR